MALVAFGEPVPSELEFAARALIHSLVLVRAFVAGSHPQTHAGG